MAWRDLAPCVVRPFLAGEESPPPPPPDERTRIKRITVNRTRAAGASILSDIAGMRPGTRAMIVRNRAGIPLTGPEFRERNSRELWGYGVGVTRR